MCRTLDLCAEAGIAVVTLPTVNLYLQDRCDERCAGVVLDHTSMSAPSYEVDGLFTVLIGAVGDLVAWISQWTQ
jgi:hypothetical protein